MNIDDIMTDIGKELCPKLRSILTGTCFHFYSLLLATVKVLYSILGEQ
jgi:hypothetical protein